MAIQKERQGNKSQVDEQEGGGDVGSSVDQSLEPLVPASIGVGHFVPVDHDRGRGGNAKRIRKRQVRTVGPGLIPSLHRCADGAQNDGEVEREGLLPPVQHLVPDGFGFVIGDAGDRFELGRVSSDESTLDEQFSLVLEAVGPHELVHIRNHLIWRQVRQRVFDPASTGQLVSSLITLLLSGKEAVLCCDALTALLLFVGAVVRQLCGCPGNSM